MNSPMTDNPLHVLLIESNEHDIAVFQHALEKGGLNCAVKTSQRAEEAERLLNNTDGDVDLVVVDFDLPGINGLEFYKRMCRKKTLPPFVMLISPGSESLIMPAIQAGFYDYIVKDAQKGYLILLPVVLTTVVKRHAQDQARRSVKSALKITKDELENQVQERTAAMVMTVQALESEIEDHQQTEAALRKSREQLRELSRQIMDAQENERKMVAQEIHDSIGGSLAAIKFALEEKLESMEQTPPPKAISLEKIISYVDETIKETRRISAHLRPSLLDDIGLLATISSFCREFEKLYPVMQIDQQLNVAEDEVPDVLKVVVYRVMQEALNNVGKHSEATRVRLQLDKRDNHIELAVADNGCGFDPAEKLSDTTVASGLGLSGMRDRAMLCDGKFEIASEPGKGTTVQISLPCDGISHSHSI